MIHTDHLGTPQKMTDASGTVVWAADYKPFGETTITVSTITNNLRFPGQYLDAETGLNYNYKRDYNPTIDIYIESDPLNLGSIRVLKLKRAKKTERKYERAPQRQNLFTYALNNPLKYTDPLGYGAVGGSTASTTGSVGYDPDPVTGTGGTVIIEGPTVPGTNDPEDNPPQHMPHWACELLVHSVCHVTCEPLCGESGVCLFVCPAVAITMCPGEAGELTD